MIEIRNLKKSFGQNIVLNDLSLSIQTGEVLGIIGASGTGKSTLLRCINLLEKPDSGIITIGNISVSAGHYTSKEAILLRQNTAMVFQNFGLFHRKTALENVMEGLVVVKKMAKSEAKEIAVSQLEKVGMGERMDYYPSQLSGGQQQRVAIARALAMRPQLLLLDEPTSALDPELISEVLATIKKAADDGNTMMIVSHEMNFIRQISNRVIMLENGSIIEDGSPEQVFENPLNPRTRDFITKMAVIHEQ